MSDDAPKERASERASNDGNAASQEDASDARGLGDFVRRAVSAGFEVASRSKDDLVRVATTEIRSWLDRLDLDTELARALSRMVVEVKAEIRFRQNEDGTLVPESTVDTKIKK